MTYPQQQQEAQVAWRAAFQLADLVAKGGRPPAIAPTIMLRPGEVQHGSLVVHCAAFFAMDVEYETSYVWGGGLISSAIGLGVSAASNAAARNRAQRMAQAQWRPFGLIPAAVTNQRLLLMIEHQWSMYELEGIVSINLDLACWTMLLNVEGVPPLTLRGPWAPWLAVVICASTYGRPWPPGVVFPAPAVGPGWYPPPAGAAPHPAPAPGPALPPRPAPRPALPPGTTPPHPQSQG